MNWLPLPPLAPVFQIDLERLQAKIIEVFGIPYQLLGVTYAGEIIPTGPVVESTIENE